MSKYELDAHDVQVILRDLRGHSSAMASEIADRIEAQIPLPAPAKIGAVVRTEKGVLIRVSPDGGTNCEWWLMGEGETIVDQGKQWVETANLGRITEVLSEGVDL